MFGSETPIDNTDWIQLEPVDSFYSGWGVDTFAFNDFGGGVVF